VKLAIVTLGTHGDVQPLVALGKGLQEDGHQVTIAAPKNFQAFVRHHRLSFEPLRIDSRELLQSSIGRQALGSADSRLSAAYRELRAPYLRLAAQDLWVIGHLVDAMIYHPLVLEELGGLVTRGVPYMIASVVGIRVRQNPECARDLGEQPALVVCGYSETIVPREVDDPGNSHVTGYWVLAKDSTWQPPASLERFLEAGEPPVYVGFGSTTVPDPARTTRIVLDALTQTGQRGILASGWGGLQAIGPNGSTIFHVDDVPHDWLFPQVKAVVHHGGAGTVAAGFRAGKPTVVCPLCNDQFFWGARVRDLGVGPAPIPLVALESGTLTQAIQAAVSDVGMSQRAEQIGQHLRAEDGVGTAVRLIEQHLLPAVRQKRSQNLPRIVSAQRVSALTREV